MKDLPFNSIQKVVDRTLLPLSDSLLKVKDEEKTANSQPELEAAVVNVPRTKAKDSSLEDPAKVLDSILKEVRSEKDIASVHGSLDASRVFDLLDDTNE